MADPIADTMTWLTTGNPPPIMFIFIAVATFVVIYMLLSKKPSKKEFKPLNMRKEVKRRLNNEYRFFGLKLGQGIFDVAGTDKDGSPRYESKPFGYVIGYMKAVWFEQFKKYEAVHPNVSKPELMAYCNDAAQSVYQKPYDALDDTQKKNIMELAKEELRYNATEVRKDGQKIVNGKIEKLENEPVAAYIMKICPNNLLYRIVAQLTNIGTNYFLFTADQVKFDEGRVVLTRSFQRVNYNDQFIFNQVGAKLIDNIGFAYEREENLSATANAIPRVLAHDNDTARMLLMKREEAEIEGKKWARVKEGQE